MIDVKNNTENPKLCFTAFIFGSYKKYIPYYIYSISKTYPETYVKLFVDNVLDDCILKALVVIKNNGYSNFEIIVSDFENLNYFNEYKIKGGGPKTLFRWLFDNKYFKEFDYLYYGDIDILVLPEKISLLELHKRKSKEFGVPISNAVRVDEEGRLVKRLTGLHFVDVKSYFEKINPIIHRLLNDNDYKEQIMLDVCRDEELLYKINKEAFDFDDNLLSKFRRPIHGMHLGVLRSVRQKDLTVNNHLNQDHLSISIEELKDNLLKYYSDYTFREINRLIFLEELYLLNDFLGIKNSIYWKVNNFKFKYLSKGKWIKKIKKILLFNK